MFDTDNRLLDMIKHHQIPLGMQCFTGDRALIEVLGLTGFDFVMLDTEHSATNPRAIEDAVLAAQSVGLVPLVRVPHAGDETAIRRALEAGAQGLFVPEVRSAADVRQVLDAALFPPSGTRAIRPATAARYSYRSFVDYAEWNNRNFLVVPHIENPDAVDHIDEICALDQVHVVAFGGGDYAYAIGEGNNMTGSAKVREAYLKVQAAADRHGAAVIGGPVLDPTVEGCQAALRDGIRVFCLGLDVMGFRRFCEHAVHCATAAVQGSGCSRPEAPARDFAPHTHS
jgi:2-keto-3-deoxy-L-rhamnonate aldolase RhmA